MESQPPKEESTILLFGPQILSPDAQLLHDLRSSIHDDQRVAQQAWAFTVLAELPEFWDRCISQLERLRSIPGRRLLQDLQRWLTRGPEPKEETAIAAMPNTILTPLVVLTQLSQVWSYLDVEYGSIKFGLEVLIEQKTRTLGFCTGLLSAYAVSSASNEVEFARNCAVAVRLAMLIGAVVDEFDMKNGRATSLATVWQTKQQGTNLARVLSDFSEQAYTSVRYDERKSTLTVSESMAPELLKRIRAVDIVANEVGLSGRFHTAAHAEMRTELVHLCGDEIELQFTDAAESHMLTYNNNTNGQALQAGRLHEHALEALLVQHADWYGTFAAVNDAIGGNSQIFSFGSERCVPPSSMRKLNAKLIQPKLQSKPNSVKPNPSSSWDSSSTRPSLDSTNDNDIAIVGLSIKVAGANDLDDFSTLLQSGISQHTEVPPSRVFFGTKSTPWRPENAKQKWFGNFVGDVDAFDHQFFQRSPRESAAMDPQQRLFLQAAYQAVEVAGVFAHPKTKEDKAWESHVGVYVGTCATDYENNIACHSPGAFSATGLLRSFIAGKVSHFFGWTGPSMTFDTACSGAAVAIHTACRAILNGECSAALAGGVNIISSPLWFQNLAGASFLSPTGQCKPFDDSADGYCRGEGIGCLFLKPMKAAIANGDRIFGRIAR